MTNAKQELLNAVRDTVKIKCASIHHDHKIFLKLNHSEEDYIEFLNLLNFTYDAGFGAQELHGTVWLEDGTWLSRGEYDGSEWWVHNGVPGIPDECL